MGWHLGYSINARVGAESAVHHHLLPKEARNMSKTKVAALMLTLVALSLFAFSSVSLANSGNAMVVRQINLDYAGDPQAFGVTDAATGNLKILADPDGFDRYELNVQGLRCRGVSFSDTERAFEAVSYYRLYINGEAIATFNTSCMYAPPDITGNFSSKIVVDNNTAYNELSDALNVEIRLEPAGGVALSGSQGAQ